jgi:RNA recognition motif-containing protein
MPRVYFDNLAHSVTRDDLKKLFSRAGEVRGVLVLTDKLTGQSRGVGCVDMAEHDDALYAIKYLNGTEIGGKPIRIDPVLPSKKTKKV